MSGTTWTKFYWSDWESDPALRLCSLAAQGLWMRMLCIASAHDPIGYVAVAGRGLDETALARMTGCSGSEVIDLLGELERNGVFSRDRTGRIYSRRMVSDAKKAAIARKNGKQGGNPSLAKQKEKSASDNPPDNTPLKTQEPEARSQIKDADASSVGRADVKAAFDEWNDLARRIGLPVAKDLTPERRKHIRARLASSGLDGWREALAAVEASPHCRGENNRGWRADIDFVATAAKFAKLREGSYGATPPSAANDAPSTASRFAETGGPDSLRKAVVDRQGEPYARSYLDPCRWDASTRRLSAANAYALDRLTRDFGDLAASWKFAIVADPAPSPALTGAAA